MEVSYGEFLLIIINIGIKIKRKPQKSITYCLKCASVKQRCNRLNEAKIFLCALSINVHCFVLYIILAYNYLCYIFPDIYAVTLHYFIIIVLAHVN